MNGYFSSWKIIYLKSTIIVPMLEWGTSTIAKRDKKAYSPLKQRLWSKQEADSIPFQAIIYASYWEIPLLVFVRNALLSLLSSQRFTLLRNIWHAFHIVYLTNFISKFSRVLKVKALAHDYFITSGQFQSCCKLMQKPTWHTQCFCPLY